MGFLRVARFIAMGFGILFLAEAAVIGVAIFMPETEIGKLLLEYLTEGTATNFNFVVMAGLAVICWIIFFVFNGVYLHNREAYWARKRGYSSSSSSSSSRTTYSSSSSSRSSSSSSSSSSSGYKSPNTTTSLLSCIAGNYGINGNPSTPLIRKMSNGGMAVFSNNSQTKNSVNLVIQKGGNMTYSACDSNLNPFYPLITLIRAEYNSDECIFVVSAKAITTQQQYKDVMEAACNTELNLVNMINIKAGRKPQKSVGTAGIVFVGSTDTMNAIYNQVVNKSVSDLYNEVNTYGFVKTFEDALKKNLGADWGFLDKLFAEIHKNGGAK